MTRHPFDSWFNECGAYVLVDGSFGSTGKGLLANYMTNFAAGKVNVVTTNAAPNSGHSAWIGDDLVITRQVPVMSVALKRMGQDTLTYINAGAMIDPKILSNEMLWLDYNRVAIHPCAAIITEDDANEEKSTIEKNIASTGKGGGAALAHKIRRDQYSIARNLYLTFLPSDRESWDNFWNWNRDVVFVEVSQGHSLGVNSASFYPYTTSRECGVAQALSDARIPPQMLKKVVMTCRTYPIRVGNTEGHSGFCYPDQRELQWADIGVEPELTTVTKRVRRVFTWSRIQFREAVANNHPDVIFLNFAQYLGTHGLEHVIRDIREDYEKVTGKELRNLLLGFGPRSEDVRVA